MTAWKHLYKSDEAAKALTLERIEAQLDFAEGIAPGHKAVTAARRLLDQALGRAEDPRAILPAFEKTLAPLARLAKAMTIHFTGHAHIDMNWMWSWPETVAVSIDTFSTMLKLMEEYPEFTFSQSQASIYALLERHHPEMLARIAQRVREGRWEVTASHWVEGDKNMANGESLTRHILLTREYMNQLFGLAPEDVPLDWAPDTFGHAASIPNYLAAGGVKYCYLHRPGVYTEKIDAFRWVGTDKSEVIVYNDMKSTYNGSVTTSVARACLSFAKETGIRDYLFVYGCGDHGGGPSRRDIERILDMQNWPVYPTLKFSTVKSFFDSLARYRRKLPVISGELNTEFTGCYTSQSLIKKANRISENRLFDAEFAAVIAAGAAGRKYPGAMLDNCWKEALFTHFHDILPGSGVHDTRTYTHGTYQRIIADLATEETLALRSIAQNINTSSVARISPAGLLPATHSYSSLGAGAGLWTADGAISTAELHHDTGERPFVLFNSLSTERTEIVEVTVWDDAPPLSARTFSDMQFEAVDSMGNAVPVQKTSSGTEWGHPYIKLVFPASVPPLGYAVYVIREADPAVKAKQQVDMLSDLHHCCYVRKERDLIGMQNGILRFVVDPETGGILSLTSLKNGTEWIDSSSRPSLLRFGMERPGPMNSWLIEHTGGWNNARVLKITPKLRGPYRSSIAVDLQICESRMTVTYSLDASSESLQIDISGAWFQRGTPDEGIPALRMEIPSTLKNPKARYEIPFGAITRSHKDGEEQPGLQWMSVSDRSRGLLLTNDCKYGFGLNKSTFHATLIRSSYDPDPLPEVNVHSMRFRLMPFEKTISDARAIEEARSLNHPLRIIGTGIHDGRLPTRLSAVTLKGASLSSLRMSKEGMVVRIYETASRQSSVTLQVNSQLTGTFRSAALLDLMDRVQHELPFNNGIARLSLKPNSMATILLSGKGASSRGNTKNRKRARSKK